MKKITLFIALAAFSLSSCSHDDNDARQNVITITQLDGNWTESAPQAQWRSMAFDGHTATLSRADGLAIAYHYDINGNKLVFTSANGEQTQHTIEVVNEATIKISDILILGTAEIGNPETVTFGRILVSPGN